MDVIAPAVHWFGSLLWGYVLIYVVLGVGVYFSIATRFVQLRHFGLLWRLVLSSRSGAKGGISSFQAFCIGLSSRVGTGNIAGVAIALTLGGPGAIFWMWCVAMLGMATAFVEATLAQIFKVAMPDGSFRGGPAFYIERGLGSRFWGIVFAVLLIFTFGVAFNAVQANTIAGVLLEAHTVDPRWTGVVLAVIAAFVVFGGMSRIARVAEWVMPAMALGYVAMGLVILVVHADRLPAALLLILKSAFGFAPVAAGVGGGIAAALLNGIKRGLFSNEAGMGSAPNTAASATVAHPAIQGFVQSVGVFIDTMVICTMTALLILVSGLYDPAAQNSIAGAELTQTAVTQTFGAAGQWLMTVMVFAFAFSSVLGNYAYAEANLTFLRGSRSAFLVLRIVVLLSVLLGSVAELPFVWSVADIAMGLMTLVNVTALVLLVRWMKVTLADYENARASGRDPTFVANEIAGLPVPLSKLVW
jgi:AGCS family alanine or glycine:cation symporter